MDFDEEVKGAWEAIRKKSPSKKDEIKKEFKEAMNPKVEPKESKEKKAIREEKIEKKPENEIKDEEDERLESIEDAVEDQFESKLPEAERFALRTAAPRAQMRAAGISPFEEDEEEKKTSYDDNGRKYDSEKKESKEEKAMSYAGRENEVAIKIETPIIVQNRTFFEKPDIKMNPIERDNPDDKRGLYAKVEGWKPDYDSKEHFKKEDGKKYKSIKDERKF